ncbi:hypothetical protein NDN11_14555 [Acinetobacter sp. C26M]|uniref:hypothetical protein n=1 Tax=unclassified Acinetobacter TaxID=196816 RepID=UPI0020373813|nr:MULTISPECIES: hypothetical protein [unclassified Acinetobacter]USA45919.1 hypothetical protein NDN11_14555 [Acinetobacter sp. C26M]USA49402.1 hypothetical protein NDN12_14470 [Acinetobacter sp. C26G]
MAVNKHRPHITVFLEDSPYREIFNGIKQVSFVNENILDVKNPCGGWKKVFSNFEENLELINKNIHQHVFLIMDYDDEFEKRMEKFNKIISDQPCKERVFLFGIDKSESEDLKRFLHCTDNEKIGKLLIESCEEKTYEHWSNIHLQANFPEINRFKAISIYKIFLNFCK